MCLQIFGSPGFNRILISIPLFLFQHLALGMERYQERHSIKNRAKRVGWFHRNNKSRIAMTREL